MDENFIDEIERIVDTRDKHFSKISFEYSLIKSRFDENIEDVKIKFSIADSIDVENQKKEIWRSQIVFLESSLDFYLHEIIKFGFIKMFNNEWDETEGFKDFSVSLGFAIELAKYPENAETLLDEIDKGNHKLCFMRFDNIIKNLKLIGIKISFSDKEIINEIYKRRNQIAHQTDRNPPKTEKQDITRELVEMYINKIEELVEAIDKAIKNKDGC